MSSIAHTATEIEIALRRGLTPQTDNEAALVELGFVRSSPHRSGYESAIWERSRDHSHRASNGLRLFVRDRVVLVSERTARSA